MKEKGKVRMRGIKERKRKDGVRERRNERERKNERKKE